VSWDVSVFGGNEPPPVDNFPPDWEPPIIGSAHEVRASISAHLPDVDWSDPGWGLYGGKGFTFEFSITGDPVRHIMVYVRGSGDAVADLLRFATPNGWYLLDWSSGRLIDHQNPSSCWEEWQEYAAKIRKQGLS
jgi:hypothetical protein